MNTLLLSASAAIAAFLLTLQPATAYGDVAIVGVGAVVPVCHKLEDAVSLMSMTTGDTTADWEQVIKKYKLGCTVWHNYEYLLLEGSIPAYRRDSVGTFFVVQVAADQKLCPGNQHSWCPASGLGYAVLRPEDLPCTSSGTCPPFEIDPR